MGDIGKYFDRKEFACKCGCGLDAVNDKLVFVLDEIRGFWCHPLVVTSGCRCGNHNRAVGGSKDSSHLIGLAVDIKISSSADRYIVIAIAIRQGIRRIGIGGTGKGFMHLDVDPSLPDAVWSY